MQQIVVDAAQRLDLTVQGLLLRIAKAHPKRFTNPEEIAVSWYSQLRNIGCVPPYVRGYCMDVLKGNAVMTTPPNPTEYMQFYARSGLAA